MSTGPLRRGIQPFGPIVISTCFPLGIAWARRVVDDGTTITVYPKVLPVEGYFLYKLPPSLAGSGGLARGSRSTRQSTSTRGVREYVRGDSPRIVHWASSARTGRLLVREFEAEGLPKFDVMVDLTANWQSHEQFELAVTTAASLLALGYRLGIGPRLLLTPCAVMDSLDLPPNPPGLQADMEVLARVSPVTPNDPRYSHGAPGLASEESERTVVFITPAGPQRTVGFGGYHIQVADHPAGNTTTSAGSTLISQEEDVARL